MSFFDFPSLKMFRTPSQSLRQGSLHANGRPTGHLPDPADCDSGLQSPVKLATTDLTAPSSSDPWYWTVDEVIEKLCTETTWLARVLPHGNLPEPTSFEQLLRTNDISGSVLLVDIDDRTIRDDLGIRRIGQVAAVKRAIFELRKQSPEYLRQVPGTPNLTYAQSLVPQSISQAPPVFGAQFASPRVQNWVTNLPSNAEADNELVPPVAEERLNAVTTAHAGETLVADPVHGKRRRVAPELISCPEVLAAANDSGDAQGLLTPPELDAGCKEVSDRDQGSRKKRRIEPILLTADDTSIHSLRPQLTAILIDEVFFGHARLGERLASDSKDDRDDERPMEFVGTSKAPRMSHYIYRQMLHFLSNAERKLVDRKRGSAVALFPYRERILPAPKLRSALLFEAKDTEVEVLRHDAAHLESGLIYDKSSNHDWDFLLHWHNGDKNVLPAVGDSDPEDDLEMDPSTMEEIEAEAEDHARPKRGPLPREELEQIVADAIEQRLAQWKEKKLPLREHTAWSTWNKGRHAAVRPALIAHASQELQRLDKRLGKLTEEIVSQQWNKPSDVQAQLPILDETVYQREDAKWRIAVWQSRVAPTKPKTKPKVRRREQKPVDQSDSSEELGSDLELAAEPDDFIDQDEQMEDPQLQPPTPRSGQHEVAEESTIEVDAGEGAEEVGDEAVDEDTDEHVDDGDGGNAMAEADVSSRASTIEHDAEHQPSTPVAPSATAAKLAISTPVRPRMVFSQTIDLSSSSSPDGRTFTTEDPIKNGKAYNDDPDNWVPPEVTTNAQLRLIQFDMLRERDDRKRLVMKILLTIAERPVYVRMRKGLLDSDQEELLGKIVGVYKILYKGDESLPDGLREDYQVVKKWARLYTCYDQIKEDYWDQDFEDPNQWDILANSILDDPSDFEEFYEFLKKIMNNRPNQVLLSRASTTDPTGSAKAEQVDSDSDDVQGPYHSPVKPKRRVVQHNQAALNQRRRAQERQMVQESSQLQVDEDLLARAEGKAPQLLINNAHKPDEGDVFVHPKIAAHVKAHQLEGIRFLWREVVTTGKEDKLEGCLLAHDMGLGKTMQTITLLVAIAEAASSEDETVRRQVPRHLRQPRILVVLPASLIQNWLREFSIWLPTAEFLGRVRHVDSTQSFTSRLAQIREWKRDGGVLCIGHQLLIQLASLWRPKTYSAEEHREMRECLLKGPSIVIADEAHALKNREAQISLVCAGFDTRSRIALTGTPLANDVEEYFALIDWVAPGYLGPAREFRSYYQLPIEEGSYKESSASDRKRAMKRLKQLKDEIEPKVHRREITTLKNELPNKVEFVITLPLTPLQRETYSTFVSSLGREDRRKRGNNARLWAFIGSLLLICNHPQIFLTKLKTRRPATEHDSDSGTSKAHESRAQLGPEQATEGAEPDANSVAEDRPMSPTTDPNLGILAEDMVREQIDILEAVDNLASPLFSGKMALLIQILDLAMAVGDKVLVFSQSIPTLDYLQDLLRKRAFRVSRLDGSVATTKRSQLAENFNAGMYDVFLISTKAGGVGINLPGANRVVIFDFQFNPLHEKQAIGRAYRIGQDKPVFVYRFLTGGTFESVVIDKAVYKTQLFSKVVDKKNPLSYAEKSSRFLFPPREVMQEDLTTHVGKDAAVLDKILARQPLTAEKTIRAIITTETFEADAQETLNAQDLAEVEQAKLEKKRASMGLPPLPHPQIQSPIPPSMQSQTPTRATAPSSLPAQTSTQRPPTLQFSKPTEKPTETSKERPPGSATRRGSFVQHPVTLSWQRQTPDQVRALASQPAQKPNKTPTPEMTALETLQPSVTKSPARDRVQRRMPGEFPGTQEAPVQSAADASLSMRKPTPTPPQASQASFIVPRSLDDDL